MIHSKKRFLTRTVPESKNDSVWCKLRYVEAVAYERVLKNQLSATHRIPTQRPTDRLLSTYVKTEDQILNMFCNL